MSPLSVLNVHAGQDTAGQSVRMQRGFARHAPDWPYRSVVRTDNYIEYPFDLRWEEAPVQDMWNAVDVVHLHNNFQTARMLERRAGDKPTVIHFHGSHFRLTRKASLAETRYRNAVGIVSTLDLHLIAPDELEWLPAPYDIDWLASLRMPIDDGKIRIASAPTNRLVKSTDAFLEAFDRLAADYPVELVLIERQPWLECLRLKATADIYFDQIKLGFGCNSIEAWGMGLPVVAGAADATLDEYERRFGYLPFYHATPETIYDALLELVESPALRAKYGALGNRYVRDYHDDAKVVRQLQDIYNRAVEPRKRVAA